MFSSETAIRDFSSAFEARPEPQPGILRESGLKMVRFRPSTKLQRMTAAMLVTSLGVAVPTTEAFGRVSWETEIAIPDDSDVLVSTAEHDINSELSAELVSYKDLKDGWDGPGSVAPHPDAIREAMRFIDLIPNGAATPEVFVAGDGEVGFYWRTEIDFIDVGFRGSGVITFYARVGGVEARGAEPYKLKTALPKGLSELIESI